MHLPEKLRDALPGFGSSRAVTTRLVAVVFLSLVGMTVVMSLIVALVLRFELARTIPLELESLAIRTAAQLDRDTAERLREIQVATTELQLGSTGPAAEAKRSQLETLRDRMSLAWVGLAHENGTIAVATDSALERSSAFRFPWFRGGLAGPYVGDVHEVPELEDTVGAEARFVPYAAPVRDEARVVGVLCGELEWEMHQLNVPLPPDSDQRQLVLSIYNGAGVHLLASDGHHNRPSLPAAAIPRGNRGYFVEASIQTDMLTGFARCRPTPGGSGAGNFVMIRQPVSAAYAPAWRLASQVALAGLIMSVAFTIPCVSFARRLRRTFYTLEIAADRIASGDSSAILPSGRHLDELSTACEALNRMVATLRERIVRASERHADELPAKPVAQDTPKDDGPRKIYW